MLSLEYILPTNSWNMYMQDRIAFMINILKYKCPKILNMFCTYKYDNKLSKYSDLLSQGHNIHTVSLTQVYMYCLSPMRNY